VSGRHEAYFATLLSLEPGETVFLLSGQVPSRQGYALIHDWFGVVYKKGTFSTIESLASFITRSRLKNGTESNLTEENTVFPGQPLLADAVSRGEKYVYEKLAAYKKTELPKVHSKFSELDKLLHKHEAQLEIDFGNISDKAEITLSKKQRKQQLLKEMFREYREWIDETKTPQECVHILVHAAFCGRNN
jgi:hypothetical protein